MLGWWSNELLKIFWERIDYLLEVRIRLIMYSIDREVLDKYAKLYADVGYEKSEGPERVVRFTDGTALANARLKGHLSQRIVHSVRKRKHILKFQAVNRPGGLIDHGNKAYRRLPL